MVGLLLRSGSRHKIVVLNWHTRWNFFDFLSRTPLIWRDDFHWATSRIQSWLLVNKVPRVFANLLIGCQRVQRLRTLRQLATYYLARLVLWKLDFAEGLVFRDRAHDLRYLVFERLLRFSGWFVRERLGFELRSRSRSTVSTKLF